MFYFYFWKKQIAMCHFSLFRVFEVLLLDTVFGLALADVLQ